MSLIKVGGTAAMMLIFAAAPALAQTARASGGRSPAASAAPETAPIGVKQIDAANQMDQARLAMMAGDYIAAEAHMKNAAAATP
jgi:hypothetical protein